MMGRWWKSRGMLKTNLAAGGVAALLLLSACGDEAENKAEGQQAAETVAAIDPAQAPVIQKGIEDYLALVEGRAEQKIIHHTAVKVTPGTDAFDVAIEGIQIGVKDKDYLDVGTVSYRLTPKGTEGYTASDLKHAASFPFRVEGGKEEGSLALTTKSFSGEWSSTMESFLALDWQAADLIAKDTTADGGDMRAGGVGINVSSTDKSNGVFDQKAVFTLDSVSIKETSGGTLSLGKLTGIATMTDLKLKDYVAKTREMQTMMTELAEKAAVAETATTDPATPPPSLSPEQAKKMGDLIKSASGLVGGVIYDFDVENIAFKEADGSEPFALKTGNFDLKLTGLNAEKASIGFAIGHDGLVIKDPELAATPLFEKLLPAKGSLDLTLSDIPSKELWNLIGDQFPGLVTGDQNQAEAAMNVLFVAMTQLLQQSPMKLTVAPSGLDAEAIQVDASGAFDVHPDAVLGLIGALDVDVHGLDAALQLATEAAQTSPDAAQVVGSLAMIQSLAKRETSSDGKPVDKLKLEVDATGDAKVNGVSLSGM